MKLSSHFVHGVASIAALAALSSTVLATKGVQAVMFSRWSDESMDNFLSTAIDSGPKTILVGCEPFFQSRRAERFKNMRRTIIALREAKKKVKFVVYFSFHDATKDHVEYGQDFVERGAQFAKFLRSKVKPEESQKLAGKTMGELATFEISPELEDEYAKRSKDGGWAKWDSSVCNILLGMVVERNVITEASFSLLNKIGLRRCVGGDSIAPDGSDYLFPRIYTFTQPCLVGVDPNTNQPIIQQRTIQVDIKRENHRRHTQLDDPTRGLGFQGYEGYSNDGWFVYYPDSTEFRGPWSQSETVVETPDSFANVNEPKDYKPTVGQLSAFSALFGQDVLLWRPAYNLFLPKRAGRTKSGQTLLGFERKVAAVGGYESDDHRVKDDVCFNSREAAALKAFWKGR